MDAKNLPHTQENESNYSACACAVLVQWELKSRYNCLVPRLNVIKPGNEATCAGARARNAVVPSQYGLLAP